jgi:glycosyltransferase involved in cell wall biosynthesis
MVTISCSGKLHAFALAEQMEKLGQLDTLYTAYAYQKNTWLRRLVKRIDKEHIPKEKIMTSSLLAFPMKLFPGSAYTWNDFFDRWVASHLKTAQTRLFIGWSGMSLHAIRVAKERGMKTIVERGSTHIVFQNEILKEEYRRFGKDFSIDKRVVEKEIQEYEEADFISIPSQFVKRSFLEKGIDEQKLLLNPYGAGNMFGRALKQNDSGTVFRILYLGTISIRKGLIYLFEALNKLSIHKKKYEVWFIGAVADDMKESIRKYQQPNWIWKGHIPHYDLPSLISQCDLAVQPSLEEGMSMVIPQMLACGIPVIASANSGGEEIIRDGDTGYIIPVRDPSAIAQKIEVLFTDQGKLSAMKDAAANSVSAGFSWDDYGKRYQKNLEKILTGRIGMDLKNSLGQKNAAFE